jgi:CO/xanthine dehydrogenase FAD-binding subunit
MRGYLPDYQLTTATNLTDALIQMEKGAKPFAGGTDIMVLLDAGSLTPGSFVSLLDIKELRGIKIQKNIFTLGALTTYSEVRDHKLLQKHFPVLCQSAQEVGAIAIQNRGTIGGNIANGSPAADFPPGLLIYEALIHLVSRRGLRTVDYTKFHSGYKKNLLENDELIHSVSLINNFKDYHHFWRKVGSRKAQAISKTMIAGIAKLNKKRVEDLRVAFGSVAATAVRCYHVENFLKGKNLSPNVILEAKKILGKDIQPIDDIRSTGKYRLAVSQNVLEEFLCGIGSDK